MSCFDEFIGPSGLAVQLKTGPCIMLSYCVGDAVAPRDFPDAIYHGLEGVVVIFRGRVHAVVREWPTAGLPPGVETLPHITKWGDPFEPAGVKSVWDHHPMVRGYAKLQEEFQESRRGKSLCPADLDIDEAQAMLETGFADDRLPSGNPRRIFAKRGEVWYRAQAHADGCYHGSPVTEQIVPPEARNTNPARWIR